MREPKKGPGHEDVALLVDWENLKFSLMQRNRKPNVTALREAAERFGRVAYARAYADWMDPVQAGDPASLYTAGLEPVYVLTRRYTTAEGDVRIQNSVDVKLAVDCVEASHLYPNIGTFVIASGDHSFFHVVMLLRSRGKRVVVIGVSWATSAQLVQQADVVLYYDLDVEPDVERAAARAAVLRRAVPGVEVLAVVAGPEIHPLAVAAARERGVWWLTDGRAFAPHEIPERGALNRSATRPSPGEAGGL